MTASEHYQTRLQNFLGEKARAEKRFCNAVNGEVADGECEAHGNSKMTLVGKATLAAAAKP